jgi:3-oxoacyl-[acyl-carrier protein] reductase
MDKRTALLIGGTKGIGAALAQRLQNDNWEVYTAARSEATGNHQIFDAADSTQSLTLPEKLDAVVYLPGTINLKPFHRIGEAELMAEFQTNFFGAFRVLQQTFPALKKGTNPAVVLFSTVAVTQGMPFHAGIAAAKGALEGLTRSLAAEWAPTVRVNAIAPSLTDTGLAEKLLNTDAKKQASADRHPLKKVGTPDDLAAMAAYLISDQAGWITGQIFHVDGGMSAVRTV